MGSYSIIGGDNEEESFSCSCSSPLLLDEDEGLNVLALKVNSLKRWSSCAAFLKTDPNWRSEALLSSISKISPLENSLRKDRDKKERSTLPPRVIEVRNKSFACWGERTTAKFPRILDMYSSKSDFAPEFTNQRIKSWRGFVSDWVSWWRFWWVRGLVVMLFCDDEREFDFWFFVCCCSNFFFLMSLYSTSVWKLETKAGRGM